MNACIRCQTELTGKQQKYCSRSCLMRHNKPWQSSHKLIQPNGKQCLQCNADLKGKQDMFCCTSCKLTFRKGAYNAKSYEKQQERGITRKLFYVEQRGGKCSECGYSRNLASLAFHHENESTKSFALDLRQFSNRTADVIESELSKCILLCHNCHSETHHPNLDLSLLMQK